jgi:hypothetical protein
VPDGSQAEIALVDPEGRLGLRQLNIGGPQRLRRPVGDIGPQDVIPFAGAGPLLPLRARGPIEPQGRSSRGVLPQMDLVAAGGAAVPFENAPDLAFGR